MARQVPVITFAELENLHTGSLMSRRTALLKCEESFELSDADSDETEAGFICYKNSAAWADAYRDLKLVLATREHLPNKVERKLMRQQKAKRSR